MISCKACKEKSIARKCPCNVPCISLLLTQSRNPYNNQTNVDYMFVVSFLGFIFIGDTLKSNNITGADPGFQVGGVQTSLGYFV